MSQSKSAAEELPVIKCDNHPDRDAVLTSDLGGVIQTINLCEQCVNAAPHLRQYV